MAKPLETVLEINLNHLEHNYQYLRSKLNAKTNFLGVVKAFAYGSDALRVAQKLEQLGVNYLAVAYIKEGVQLRKAGIQTPILVLHPQTVNFKDLFTYQLEPSLYSAKILKAFLKFAKAQKQKHFPVHIKFNTGLNRLGFCKTDIDFIIPILKEANELKVISIFSHLAASEDLNEKEFTERQIQVFKNIAVTFSNSIGYTPLRHILNTSGIINYAESQFEMVRSGIGLYGFGNTNEIDAKLKPIASLKTIISQIHSIAPGESVGYNLAFIAKNKQKIATLPLGHADGIGRIYGNGSTTVLVNEKKAKIIGNVCMDMIMIDVTQISCEEGDEVLVFGEQASAHDFASNARTISYEILTSISQRVKRVFIED